MQIENADLLESIFGRWPSFHDAEIHSVVITRDCDSGPQMDVAIHHWQMTKELDAKGYYVLKNHTFTNLRFYTISDLQLAEFNSQNVLFEIEIAPNIPESQFSVSMPSSIGCEMSFNCKRIRVMSASPCDANVSKNRK